MFTLPTISRRRKLAALGVAVIADGLQLVIGPLMLAIAGFALEDAIDLVAAGLLMAICGFRWPLVVALVVELTPFLQLFPTWTAMVLVMPTTKEEEDVRVKKVEAREIGGER